MVKLTESSAHPDRLYMADLEMLYDALVHPLWKHRFENTHETARFCGPLASGMLRRIYKNRPFLGRSRPVQTYDRWWYWPCGFDQFTCWLTSW